MIQLILLLSFLIQLVKSCRNCNGDPLSNFCDTYIWESNDTCKSVSSKYNITIEQLLTFKFIDGSISNSPFLINELCKLFTEGDEICISQPKNYEDCYYTPNCMFEYPQYFCNSYTITQSNLTCLEFCNLVNISMRQFKQWNKLNRINIDCYLNNPIEIGDVYCISKPNITNSTDCISIAIAENNSDNVDYFESVKTWSKHPLYNTTNSTKSFSCDASHNRILGLAILVTLAFSLI